MDLEFRAWDKKYKKMCCGATDGWDTYRLCLIDEGLRWINKKGRLFVNDRLKDIVIMQYIGIKDGTKWEQLPEKEREQWTLDGNLPSEWEGRKIYKDEIVRIRGVASVKDIAPVDFYRGSFVLDLGDADLWRLSSINSEYIEVLGNIHENPDWRIKWN